ncbi:PLAC8 family-domain-containing protein [Russula brevipes]|nr:PLAC8 family-domain-containing protein [Russula brevipes]
MPGADQGVGSQLHKRAATGKEDLISAQPKGTAPMSVGGNRNALNCPIGPSGKRDWSYGLFDCFSACGLCCFAAWCPCIVYSKNRQRLRSLQHEGTPLKGDGETCDEHCCIHGGLTVLGYGWIMQIHTRAEVRERYGVDGSAVGDCFSAWCCRPCALTQERREIELEERNM